jgi:hypothetical protein
MSINEIGQGVGSALIMPLYRSTGPFPSQNLAELMSVAEEQGETMPD